jgi:uncharacterized protein
MRLTVVCSVILSVSLIMILGCGGGLNAGLHHPDGQLPPVEQALPAISELGTAQDRKLAAAFGDEFAANLPAESGNYSSNAIVNTGAVQLPSGPTTMSAAWYGTTMQYVLDNTDPGNPVRVPVPYIAPYEIRVTTTGGKYWFLTADFMSGKWRIQPTEVTADSQAFPIGLAANASNDKGTFWFAIVTYGGENVTITGLELDFPSQDFAALPIEVHEYITAEDGTQLATDTYLPLDTGSPLLPPPPYPVILFRTPYSKDPLLYGPLSQLIGGVNAVMMVQYFRGRLSDSGVWPDSTGTPTLFREHAGPEHTDGLDTITWIKERQFYNGDMLLAGPSALGVSAYQAATQAGSDIKGFYPIMSSSDIGSWAAERNGCFKRSNVEGWITSQNLPSGLLEQAETAYSSGDQAYWAAVDFTTQAAGVNAPGWHETGWFDVDVESTIKSWAAINSNGGPLAAGNQWLVIGPWTHSQAGSRGYLVGDLEFPNDSSLNDPSHLPAGWDALSLNQWAFFVIGRTIGYTPPANRVLAYFIGEEGNTTQPHNRWYELAGWPPVASETELFLSGANELLDTIPGDGTVDVLIDPANSVPTVGGAVLPVIFNLAPVIPGPMDQRVLGGHTGVQSFFASPPGADVSLAGPIQATLYVSVSGAVDSDVMLKLVDVYPGGGAEILIADSAVRLSRYLADTGQGALVEDQVYQIELEIGQRAWVLGDDHQLRLDIATTNYPRFDLNPSDGNAFWDIFDPSGVTGTLAVHCGGVTPSTISLPEFNPAI